jgi:hypothetical protein
MLATFASLPCRYSLFDHLPSTTARFLNRAVFFWRRLIHGVLPDDKALMASPSLNPARPAVTEKYRDWHLLARWFPVWAATASGWICYVREPGSTEGRGTSTLLRRPSAEEALQVGRTFVDRKLDGPAPKRRRRAPGKSLRS